MNLRHAAMNMIPYCLCLAIFYVNCNRYTAVLGPTLPDPAILLNALFSDVTESQRWSVGGQWKLIQNNKAFNSLVIAIADYPWQMGKIASFDRPIGDEKEDENGTI